MRASQPKKHKAACDQCNASKVKCPGGGLPCKRCADSSQPCHYSLARRIGKPPGSKNRRTLEKLRQAQEGNLENNNGGDGGGGGDSSFPQIDGNRNDGGGAVDVGSERRESDDSHDPLQMSSTTSFWPLSPLITYPTSPESSQLIPASEQAFFDGDHGVSFDSGERSVLHSIDPKFTDFEGIGRAESRRPWVDAPDDYWNVSTRPCCGLTLTYGRISLHHRALASSSLQVPRTRVCSTRSRLVK